MSPAGGKYFEVLLSAIAGLLDLNLGKAAVLWHPNQRWSPGFLSDAFAEGRRFRILAIVDVFTRECLALVADTSLPSLRVARELGAVIIRRGRSAIIVSNRVEASPHGHMPALWPRSGAKGSSSY